MPVKKLKSSFVLTDTFTIPGDLAMGWCGFSCSGITDENITEHKIYYYFGDSYHPCNFHVFLGHMEKNLIHSKSTECMQCPPTHQQYISSPTTLSDFLFFRSTIPQYPRYESMTHKD